MSDAQGKQELSEFENILVQFDDKLDRLEKLVIVVSTSTEKLGDFQKTGNEPATKGEQLNENLVNNFTKRLSRLQTLNNSLGEIADNLTRIVG
jgi:hypothetical protein